MRRVSSSLLSDLAKSTKLIARAAAQNPSPISPPRLNPGSKSQSLHPSAPRNLHPVPFPKCPPPRTIQTLPSIPTPPPSQHPELEGNSDPEETLESAATTEEILAAFEALEASIGEDNPKIGLAYLKVGQRLDSTGSSEDLKKALSFAARALKILEGRDGGGSFVVVKALHLMGSLFCKLQRFEDSLDSLSTAEQILGRLEQEGLAHSEISPITAAVQVQLANTKTAMGRRRDALLNLRRSLELKASVLESNCRELGTAYKELAEAYAVVLDFQEALPLCLKALEIHKIQFGQDSMEVAQIRRLLAVVYVGLEENEEALEQNELSQMILKSLGSENELIHAEIEAANIQIGLGRLDESINTLKGAIHRTSTESEERAFVLVSMATALCSQEKFGDSKRCLEMSCGILDKIESASPVKIAEAYAEISMVYETMTEFEISLLLMKRTLAILEKLPQERHLEGSISARIGWLLLLTGRVPQAVPYLERAVGRLKESFGPKHFGLGFVYKHLGQAYLEMDQPQSAVQMLALAKDIIHLLFGPHHDDTIDSCQCLANAYGALGSYAIAMEFQQQVVDAWESHGPNAKDEFREAHRLLEQLKKKVHGSSAAVFPANALPDSFRTKVPQH